MDDHFAHLLELMARSDEGRPVLVIGTAWPEGHNQPGYQEWLDRLRSSHGDGSPGEGLVEVIGGDGEDFPRLDEDERSALALSFAPNTGKAKIRTIAQRWSNPYALVLTMTAGRMQRHIKDGRVTLTDKDLAQMPNDIHGI